MPLTLIPTVAGLAISVVLFFVARWRTMQPARPERGPRMIPWTLIAILAATAAIIFLAHLGELAGMDMSRRPGAGLR